MAKMAATPIAMYLAIVNGGWICAEGQSQRVRKRETESLSGSARRPSADAQPPECNQLCVSLSLPLCLLSTPHHLSVSVSLSVSPSLSLCLRLCMSSVARSGCTHVAVGRGKAGKRRWGPAVRSSRSGGMEDWRVGPPVNWCSVPLEMAAMGPSQPNCWSQRYSYTGTPLESQCGHFASSSMIIEERPHWMRRAFAAAGR